MLFLGLNFFLFTKKYHILLFLKLNLTKYYPKVI